MEKPKELNPVESLQVINEMIEKAKRSFSHVSFYFLMWGVLLVIAGVVEYILKQVVHYEYFFIGWPALALIGVIIAIFRGRQYERNQPSTYTDKIFGYLWGSFGVTLILLIIGTVSNDISPTPFILLLTGLPTCASGGVIKFKPLIAGGIIFWAIGTLSFFLWEEFQSLLFSIAILFGYIIPGFMLKKSENHESV